MIGIAILVGIASLFVNFAKANDLNKWLWGVMSIVSFYAAQFLAGIFIGILAPDLLYSQGALIGISLLSGALGVGIAFFIMKNSAKKVKAKIVDTEVLDDNISDDLDSLLEE